MECRQQIIEIIAEVLGVVPESVTMELSIGDIPEWNSMANIALITAIEERLDIRIPSEDLFELTNVAAIVDKVKVMKG